MQDNNNTMWKRWEIEKYFYLVADDCSFECRDLVGERSPYNNYFHLIASVYLGILNWIAYSDILPEINMDVIVSSVGIWRI